MKKELKKEKQPSFWRGFIAFIILIIVAVLIGVAVSNSAGNNSASNSSGGFNRPSPSIPEQTSTLPVSPSVDPDSESSASTIPDSSTEDDSTSKEPLEPEVSYVKATDMEIGKRYRFVLADVDSAVLSSKLPPKSAGIYNLFEVDTFEFIDGEPSIVDVSLKRINVFYAYEGTLGFTYSNNGTCEGKSFTAYDDSIIFEFIPKTNFSTSLQSMISLYDVFLTGLYEVVSPGEQNLNSRSFIEQEENETPSSNFWDDVIIEDHPPHDDEWVWGPLV